MPTVNEVHVGGFIDDAQNTSGSLSNVQIVGSTVDNELDINGEASNKIDTTGAIDIIKNLSGSLSNSQVLRSTLRNKLKISGQGSLPIVIDRTGIHYATTATWNAEPDLVGELGHLYIYSDHSKKEMEDGSIVDVPAIKVGDGVSLLIDAPFMLSADDQDWIDHINNHTIHITQAEREYWNNKVASNVNENNEELILWI